MAKIKGKQIADGSIDPTKLIIPSDATKVLKGNGTWGDAPGGGETANVEALSADKTLTATDAPIQMFTCTANMNINLPTTGVAIGQKFEIWNKNAESSSYYLTIKQGTTELYRVTAQTKIELRWDGTNWITEWKYNISIGNNANGNYNYGVGIGNNAYNNFSNGVGIGNSANNNYSYGIGIGKSAYDNYSYGVGIGNYASGNSNYGVGIGNSASNNANYGVGIGRSASSNGKQHCTVALGAYSKAERNREIVSGSDDSTNYKSQFAVQKWKYQDITFPNGTDWIFIGIDGANGQAVALLADSVYKFRLQIAIRGYNGDGSWAENYYGEELVGAIGVRTNGDAVVLNDAATPLTTCYCTDAAEPNSVRFSAYSSGARIIDTYGAGFAGGFDFKIVVENLRYRLYVRNTNNKAPQIRLSANAVITEFRK